MFDYVIVGGGSAGCVLAGRLSEDPDVTVCLVEAGPADTTENIHVPALGGRLFRTHLDWDYDSHEEPYCDDRRIYLPRGRVIGGTSSMNGMIYIRGTRSDYDGWGQPGWSYPELLPYFKRSEDNERGASRYHGTGGPLSVADSRSNNPSATAFVDAAREAGYARNDDFNAETQEGFGAFQLTQRDGRRCSSAVAFLHPAAGRPNLTVETNVQVHRVTFDGTRATGVVGYRLDERVELRAAREVILAAGAYNSPHLLLVSGVGPAEVLRGMEIPVVLDQPEVGRNLQDHPHAWLVFAHSQPVSLISAGEARHREEYEARRTGPLSSNGPETGGFVTTGVQPGSEPDVQYNFLPVMFADGGLTPPSGHGISYGACVLRPRSRGAVTLASPEPTAKPRIISNFYAEPEDLDVAVAGLRIALDLSRQAALKPYTERALAAPASEREADLRAYVRRHTHALFHPTSTCAMGTVVDPDLKVYGLDGLRVVDASVLPAVISGNTNAPVIAIAEKAADLIRGRAPLPVDPALA